MRTFSLICLFLSLCTPALADERPVGAAVWIDSHGDADQGIAYPLARWRSLVNRERWVETVALVGDAGAGAALCREFWVGEDGDRRRSISIGLGAVVPYSAGTPGEIGVILVGVGRL